MLRTFFSRVLQAFVVFFGTSLFVFWAVFALPGDPLGALAGDAELTESVVRSLEAKYHLNEPLIAQYWYYISNLAQGDLGTTVTGESISNILGNAWPITVKLGLTAWAFELVIGLGLGCLACLKPGGLVDRCITGVTILLIAIPTFVLAFFTQQWIGLKLGLLPVAGVSAGWPVSYLLPALCIAALGIGPVARLTRTSVLETVNADFVRTAKAKGISPARLGLNHIVRNALIPVVTYLGVDLGALMGGAVLVEGIFNLPGIGRTLFTAINTQQGSIVVGIVTAGIFIVLLMNIAVDVLHRVLDPRIRNA